MIIGFGPAEVPFTLQQLRYQWTTNAMRTFLMVLGGLLCALQLLWRHISRSQAALLQQRQQAQLAQAAAQGAGVADKLQEEEGELLLPAARALPGEPDAIMVFAGAVLFSAVASFVGAWSVLFSKSLTYVVTALPGSLLDWYSWFVLAAFLATAAFWVRQSDRGLKLYPATLIMPLMQARAPPPAARPLPRCAAVELGTRALAAGLSAVLPPSQAFWMCMSVIEGGIYFDELMSLRSRDLGMLMGGLILALLGAVSMGCALRPAALCGMRGGGAGWKGGRRSCCACPASNGGAPLRPPPPPTLQDRGVHL